MEQVFNFIIQGRRAFIELLGDLSIEQLNEVPAGFNNNIIWNFGHIVVSSQALCYIRTGVRPDTAIKFVEAYAKGTKPSYFVTAEEVAELKTLALESIQQIENDYKAGVFNNMTAFETSTYKEKMSSIEEVLITTIGHDNLHYGYAAAQKKIINNK